MNFVNISSELPIGYVNRNTLEDQIESSESQQIISFIDSERRRAHRHQEELRRVWTDCWALYRGKDDFSAKQDWQSKLVLPKPFNSVKQAVNAFMRMLSVSQKPWELEPVNPDDEVTKQKGERFERLVNYFLDEAGYLKAFQEGLESSAITGIGVWKIWWSLDTRSRLNLRPGEDGSQELVKEFIQEGKLKIKAIDPYNFYWIPGEGLNKWIGTIEESWISLYQLKELARKEILDEEKVKNLVGRNSEGRTEKLLDDQIRFDKPASIEVGASPGMTTVKITEYYGPLLSKEGKMVMDNAYVVIANDNVILKIQENPYWHGKPPYVAFSPLLVPFREEGIGLVEMTREVDRALSRLANMSMDTLLFKLLPMFEAYPEAYEDDEELDSGIIPGKIIRRNRIGATLPPLSPVVSQDISQGSLHMMGLLDRFHQEGSLISEIQQGLPRTRGSQTATEINVKASRENSFISALAREIDDRGIKPIVEMAMDTILQNLDTSSDPRIATILGIDIEQLVTLNPIDVMEIIQGDYTIKVHGVNEQIEKVEVLENLVQFMNIIGQNSEWIPYINQAELFKRILDAFPNIRDADHLVNDPATIEAQRLALQNSQLSPEIIRAAPGLIRSYAQMQKEGLLPAVIPQLQANLENQTEQQEAAIKEAQELQELEKLVVKTELEARLAEAERIKKGPETPPSEQRVTVRRHNIREGGE